MTHPLFDGSISPLESLSDDLRRDLVSLYEQLRLDLSRAGATCNASGRCCRFHQYDHQLWLTNVELTHLLDTAGPPPAAAAGVCPYLKEGLCTAREGRSLGCRIFHCQMDKDTMEQLHEAYLARLRALCKQHGIDVEYGELLAALK